MSGFLLAAIVISAIAAVYDVRTGKIPDWLTLGTLLLSPVAHAARAARAHEGTDAILSALGFSTLGLVACGFVPLLLFRQGALGAPEVKLFAALGALLHLVIGFEALTYSFIAAVLLAPARLAYEGKLMGTLKNATLLLGNLFLPKAKRREVAPELMTWFRMGPAIFLGVLVTAFLHSGAP